MVTDMAWFRDYMTMHMPNGEWNNEAACMVRIAAQAYQRTGGESYRNYVLAWAENLAGAEKCPAEAWRALFFALAETGEDKFREAIGRVMVRLGRGAETAKPAELPFHMAFEMKLGGMEKVGMVAHRFLMLHQACWDAQSGLYCAELRSTAAYLLALTDAIAICSDQLYEHWRTMVDLYRESLRGVLRAQAQADAETQQMLIQAILEGVALGLIDPERYLPIARKRAAMCENGDRLIDRKGGAL